MRATDHPPVLQNLIGHENGVLYSSQCRHARDLNQVAFGRQRLRRGILILGACPIQAQSAPWSHSAPGGGLFAMISAGRTFNP